MAQQSDIQKAPKPERSCCLTIISIFGLVLSAAAQFTVFAFSFQIESLGLGMISVFLLCVLVFCCFSLFGSYENWNGLKTAVFILFMIITYIFVIVEAAAIATKLSFQMTVAPANLKKSYGQLMDLVCIIAAVELICFLLFFLPQFCLFPEKKAEKHEEEKEKLKTNP